MYCCRPIVDKERGGCLRWMCLLTIRKYEKIVPPCPNGQWEGGMGIGRGGTSRGVMSWQWKLAVVLVCAGTLVKPVEVDPIYAVTGICPGSCLGGSCMQINMASLMVLDCMLTSLCTILNWLGSTGCPVAVLWRCMWEGALKCSLTLPPSARLPNVWAGAVDVRALVFVDDSCLVGGRVLVFGVA